MEEENDHSNYQSVPAVPMGWSWDVYKSVPGFDTLCHVDRVHTLFWAQNLWTNSLLHEDFWEQHCLSMSAWQRFVSGKVLRWNSGTSGKTFTAGLGNSCKLVYPHHPICSSGLTPRLLCQAKARLPIFLSRPSFLLSTEPRVSCQRCAQFQLVPALTDRFEAFWVQLLVIHQGTKLCLSLLLE